jgi:hypothetical protein
MYLKQRHLEADSRSVGQEFPYIYVSRTSIAVLKKNQPLDSILEELKLDHTLFLEEPF